MCTTGTCSRGPWTRSDVFTNIWRWFKTSIYWNYRGRYKDKAYLLCVFLTFRVFILLFVFNFEGLFNNQGVYTYTAGYKNLLRVSQLRIFRSFPKCFKGGYIFWRPSPSCPLWLTPVSAPYAVREYKSIIR